MTLSDVIWGAWIGLFLALELAAKDVFGLAPWYSLSRTTWMNETGYPWLRWLLLGFLFGLGVHIVSEVGLLRAVGGGMFVAIAVYALWFPAAF